MHTIYSNTSNLNTILNSINNLSKTDADLFETALIERSFDKLELDEIEIIGANVFASCPSLTLVNFPSCITIGEHAFYSCSSLSTASFPACITIGSNAFNRCTNLASIYLMASSVCTLAYSNAFSSAGITSTTGSIFVPASLVDAYKSATNWTYFSNRIFNGEG